MKRERQKESQTIFHAVILPSNTDLMCLPCILIFNLLSIATSCTNEFLFANESLQVRRGSGRVRPA
jgi:hypothetical protein